MKTEISRVFRKNALVFWRNPIFRENRFFAKFRDKQDNIDLNIVFAAPLSGGSFRPSGPAMRPAPETVRRGRPSPVCGRGWCGAFRTLAGRGVKKLTQVLPLSLFFYTFTCFFYDKVKFARAFPPPCRGRKGVRSGERLLKTNLISK